MKYSLLKLIVINCILITYPVNNLFSQDYIEDLKADLFNDDELNSLTLENNYEDLMDIKDNPININSATKEQLEKLPFLSDKMIENILYYVYKYGPLKTKKELWMIEDINRRTVKYLEQFITIKDVDKQDYMPSIKNIIKYGRSELLTRFDVPLYTKKGYTPISIKEYHKNPNSRYIGYKYYHNIRYKFKYSDKIIFGITAENDAGEPFFSSYNKKGYDYYSPYLLITNYKNINALVLGNYRANYGYGLVINTDSYYGKSAMLYSLSSSGKGLKKHSSTNEYDYFTGLGISYKLFKRICFDLFYSYRDMDGVVDNMLITSVKKDGFHRLKRDFEKKNIYTNQVIGSHLNYNGKNCEYGFTFVYNFFNNMLKTNKKEYNKYYPNGKYFSNIGFHYKLFVNKFILFGETAVDKKYEIATLNGINWNISNGFQLSVINRYYDYKYQSIYAQPLSEGGRVQNESALYIGLKTRLLRYFEFSSYCDIFYFPWKKYLVNKVGTKGYDCAFQLSYSPTYQLSMLIKYRYKNKQKDFTIDDNIKTVKPYIQQKLTYQLNYDIYNNIRLKSIISTNFSNYQSEPISTGLLITQSFGYNFNTFPLSVDFSATWFNTDDYESRISIYEKDVLYAFSIPSFFNKGVRGAINIKFSPFKNLFLYAKYSSTVYSNRESISSGLEEISGNVKSDIHLLLKYKF